MLRVFNAGRRILQESSILFLTDSEGSQSFFKTIQNSRIVRYDANKGLSFHNRKEIPYLIYGGDATDRGPHALAITHLLVEFKLRYPDNVFLLAGNRDITKARFKQELGRDSIRERLLRCPTPRWLPDVQTVPLDYVKTAIAASDASLDVSDNRNLEKYIYELSIEQCQLLYLRWMLEKTMGCPHAFRYRREELSQHGVAKVSDEQVLQSFISESSPDGVSGQYLKLAQIGVVIPRTKVLAVHGGIKASNVGRVPDMHDTEMPIQDVRAWVDKLNLWYRSQIRDWATTEPTSAVIPAASELDEVVLPIPGKSKSVITADMLGEQREFVSVEDTVSKYLLSNGIQLVLTGHQPCGDHPAILRDQNTLFINGDTGYADQNSKNPDDTRGAAFNTISIAASEERTTVQISAHLSSKLEAETCLTVKGDKITGDAFVGLILPDNRLVQCKLRDGNYRLIEQKGHEVKYSVVSKTDIQAILMDIPRTRVAFK